MNDVAPRELVSTGNQTLQQNALRARATIGRGLHRAQHQQVNPFVTNRVSFSDIGNVRVELEHLQSARG